MWQQMPQQQQMRVDGHAGAGHGGSGSYGGNGGRSGGDGATPSRDTQRGRRSGPGRAAPAGVSGRGRGRARQGPVEGLMERLGRMMAPDFTDPMNPQPGALGMLPGLGMAMGVGMAMHSLGEYMGLEVGPAPEHTPGERPGDPPIAPESETDSPQVVLTPEEEQERLRMRGLAWYSGLMGTGMGSAPGA